MQVNSKELKTFYIKTLAEIIKTHRLDNNKSIYAISAESSVPRSTWRDLEFCLRKDINLSNFCKIAEGLDISPDKLLQELIIKLGSNFSFTDISD